MPPESERDASRTTVRTYVPAYQREEWDAHADELDMSRSEFVKAMVQAGRRGFDGVEQPSGGGDVDGRGTASRAPTGDSLEETVLSVLSESEYHSWQELLATVTDDIEDRLEATLQGLQAEDRVRYSGRHGGYTLES